MGDLLRRWLRSWLGIDADRDDTHARLIRHSNTLVRHTRDLTALYGHVAHLRDGRAFTSDERAAVVDRLLGPDPQQIIQSTEGPNS